MFIQYYQPTHITDVTNLEVSWRNYNQGRKWMGGGQLPPHFLADQLTLSRPGGTHYPHPVLLAPPLLGSHLRPWSVSSINPAEHLFAEHLWRSVKSGRLNQLWKLWYICRAFDSQVSILGKWATWKDTNLSRSAIKIVVKLAKKD